MCRFTIILNNKCLPLQEIKGILWFMEHSIFKQCYKEPYTPDEDFNTRNHQINLDGFGIGYFPYDVHKDNDTDVTHVDTNTNTNTNINTNTNTNTNTTFHHHSHPTIYRNIFPSWNDCNLMQILPCIKTQCMMVHIRAVAPIVNSSKFAKNLQAPVHTYNCHPFEHDGFIFCHNGLMESFYEGNLRKMVVNRISDDLLLKIKGTTDSEYIFFLLLTLIRENNDIHLSINYLIEFINALSSINVCSLNIALATENNVWVTRYINNDEIPPSLYISTECFDSVVVSSEPLKKDGCEWKLVDKNQLIHIEKNKTVTYYDI